MTTINFHENSTATPEQLLAGITDFGPGRSEIFGNSSDEFLEVHDKGSDWADVTEGTGPHGHAVSWERLRYDWSDPYRITMKVTDSNVFAEGSGHTYTLTPKDDGTTDLDVTVVRIGKGVKGHVITFAAGTVAKHSLGQALHHTVEAIEAREGASKTA